MFLCFKCIQKNDLFKKKERENNFEEKKEETEI